LLGNEIITYICGERMPTIFILYGLRFFYYSNDHNPIHVHVAKDGCEAKFSLFPVTLVENNGLKATDLKIAKAIIKENKDLIVEHWNKYFNKEN
jgi:hypothetical protein